MLRFKSATMYVALCSAFGWSIGHAQTSTQEGTEGALPAVTIKASGERGQQDQGSAREGYRSDSAVVGPVGEMPLQDAPYSINVVPRELIENLQATTPDAVFKVNPVTQLNSPQSRFFTGVTIRGFDVTSAKLVDGVPNSNMLSVDMEDKERIDVLSGLSGFLYGIGNVGGTLNYVLKRPTYERLNSVTVGNTSGANLYAHGDFGGTLDEDGVFAYRLNVLGQGGDTAVDDRTLTRKFISGALDWNISERLQLQFDASYSDYYMKGSSEYWSAAAGVKYSSAPDSHDYYGQPFTFTDTTQSHVGARANWRLTDRLKLRAGYAHRESSSEQLVANNTFIAGSVPGAYTVRTSHWVYPDITNNGYFAFADSEFVTGPLSHTLTIGFYGDTDERTNYRAGGWKSYTGQVFNLYDGPGYVDTPPAAPGGDTYTAGRTTRYNYVIGDDIKLGERWGALIGVNKARIADRSFDATGAIESSYDESRVTPSASILFKPVPMLTLYASYMEGLEAGGVASPTYNGYDVTNAGAIMSPLQSKQYEMGAKATVGHTLLTAALFQIDKGLEYYDVSTPTAPTYVQDGRQVHKGVELTATGRVLPQLVVIGGVTWLDAKVKENKQDPTLEGKTPAGVAERSAKVYVEYDIAQVPGLTLTGGIYYTGKQSIDAYNTDYLPAFTTGDIGARYTTTAGGRPLTLRVNIANVTDKSYWLKSNYLGEGRTFSVSAQMRF
jgi:iron complex outermembrane recepter protein